MVEPVQQKSSPMAYGRQSVNPGAQSQSTPSQPLSSQPSRPEIQPSEGKPKKWVWWIVGGVVLLVVISLGIWFAFFR